MTAAPPQVTAPQIGLLQINAKPSRAWTLTLSYFLFAAGILAYFYTATQMHRENPEERVMPTLQQMSQGFYDAALKPAEEDADLAGDATLSQRIFGSMLWKDTKATSRRFALSMVLLFPAVLLGMHMGLFPFAGAFFLRFVLFFDKIVALSLLPFFGEGHLLWASDYPHPDSVWPNSRDAIERQMRSLTPQMRRALTHDNAAALYGLA